MPPCWKSTASITSMSSCQQRVRIQNTGLHRGHRQQLTGHKRGRVSKGNQRKGPAPRKCHIMPHCHAATPRQAARVRGECRGENMNPHHSGNRDRRTKQKSQHGRQRTHHLEGLGGVGVVDTVAVKQKAVGCGVRQADSHGQRGKVGHRAGQKSASMTVRAASPPAPIHPNLTARKRAKSRPAPTGVVGHGHTRQSSSGTDRVGHHRADHARYAPKAAARHTKRLSARSNGKRMKPIKRTAHARAHPPTVRVHQLLQLRLLLDPELHLIPLTVPHLGSTATRRRTERLKEQQFNKKRNNGTTAAAVHQTGESLV